MIRTLESRGSDQRFNKTRKMARRTLAAVLLTVAFVSYASHSRAAGARPAPTRAPAASRSGTTPTPPDSQDPKLAKARALFKQGVAGVKQADWAAALAAFERSAALRPHATTTFNIGACERAMGQYTRAREEFRAALARNDAHAGELAPSLAGEARALIDEIDRLVAHVDFELEPSSAAIAIDGRPLRAVKEADRTVWVSDVEEPDKGRVIGRGSFSAELDPGVHVITLSRKGYTDEIVNRSFAPGSSTKLDLQLARLPARIAVSSNIRGAIVTVDQKDFGPVPVTILRPAGSYRVVVTKKGYEPYETQVAVRAGEESKLRARLVVETTPITKRWWFWTGAAAVVAGGVLATYALTRPKPSPPPYDRGSTGWLAGTSAVTF